MLLLIGLMRICLIFQILSFLYVFMCMHTRYRCLCMKLGVSGYALVKHFNQMYEKKEVIAFKYRGSNVVQKNDVYVMCTSKQRGASGY